MGPSKATTSDATFAFTPQLYRNEAKALQTQLQFNRNVPALPENLALRFSNPHPIIIEKLKASNDQRNLAGSKDTGLRSSGMFSVVSEERLKLAIQLAKRDIKRRHFEEQVKQRVFGDAVNKPLLTQSSQQQKTEAFESPENKNALKSQTHLKYQKKLGQPSRTKATASGAKLYLYTANEGKPISACLDSPPTRDTEVKPKTNVNKQQDKNTQEAQRLQKELRIYVQKIEELTKKGREREILDPDKEQKVRTRRQKQAARSARMLYVLQQQVREIQDDLEKLSPHKIKHTQKSRAVSRLAAAQRGAVRALQAFANHFTDQTEQIPVHYRQLGSLIRQLSLCSAKLEEDSSISDIIIDTLLQVEDLESLLEKTKPPKKVKKCMSASQGKSLRNTEAFPARKQLTSAKGENKALILNGQHGQEPRKPPAVQKANGCAHTPHKMFQEENDHPGPQNSATLQGTIDALVRARAVRKDPIPEGGPLKKKGVLLAAKSQGMPKSLRARDVQPRGKRARFLEKTLAFQLKENKRPVEESRAPCMPPKLPHPPVSPKRSQIASPTRDADKAEKAVQEHLEPLLDRTQLVAANADVLSEKLLDDLLEDTGEALWNMEQHEGLQAQALPVTDTHNLESLLQRMEEMERYQEAVRRRFTQIVYGDLEFWAQEHRTEQQTAPTPKRPTSPHPIQLTRLTGQTEPELDIVFEKLFDSNGGDENEEAGEKLQTGNEILQPLPQNSLQKECCVFLSVPKHMLQSILEYSSRYKHHLQLTAHEVEGSFNPWQIAESFAEQLTEEALCDVAVELQDVCEEYAEAVFTSEFLQPPSAPSSTASA